MLVREGGCGKGDNPFSSVTLAHKHQSLLLWLISPSLSSPCRCFKELSPAKGPEEAALGKWWKPEPSPSKLSNVYSSASKSTRRHPRVCISFPSAALVEIAIFPPPCSRNLLRRSSWNSLAKRTFIFCSPLIKLF